MSALAIVDAHLWGVPHATSLLARDGRIVRLGDRDEVLALAGAEAEVVEGDGRTVLPGFHDAHVHPLAGGLTCMRCDLSEVHDLEAYRARIVEYARTLPDGAWVVGGGWFGDVFPGGTPTAGELDRLVGDRPACLTSHDGHGVWVNTAALRLAGIDRTTPCPAGGRIVRDESGEAVGLLADAAAGLVTDLLPPPTAAEREEALRRGLAHLGDFGITAVHDAIIGDYGTFVDPLPAYEAIAAGGGLDLRVSGSIWWAPGTGVDGLEHVLERRARLRAAGVACDSVKIMQDGICENLTAALLQPYRSAGHGHDEHSAGESVFDPQALAEIVTAVDRANLRVHFHAVGDRAVRECLDAVAAARAANGPGPRHQIAHVDLVDPADLPRFRDLDVAANLQALWARADSEILERKLPLLQPSQHDAHFPFGSLLAAGAPLAMGSDWPVTSPDPLWAIHTAVTRTAPPHDVHARNPEATVAMGPGERLPLAAAIDAYTLGSAAVAGRAHELGRLHAGYLADLVVLDGRLREASDLEHLRVAATVVGGRQLEHSMLAATR